MNFLLGYLRNNSEVVSTMSSNDSEEDGEIDREETRYNVYGGTASPEKEYVGPVENSDSYDTEDGGEDILNIQPPQATIIMPKRERRDRKREKHSRKHESASRSRTKDHPHNSSSSSSRDRSGHRESRRGNVESSSAHVSGRGGGGGGGGGGSVVVSRSRDTREPRDQHDSRHRQHRQKEKEKTVGHSTSSSSLEARVRSGDSTKEQSRSSRDSSRSSARDMAPKEPRASRVESREARELRDARERIQEAREAREREQREREEREEREQERLQREWRKERLLVVDQSVLQREREREQRKAEPQRLDEGGKPFHYATKSGNPARDRSRSPISRGAAVDDHFDDVPVISLDIEDEPLTDMEEEMHSPVRVLGSVEAPQEAVSAGEQMAEQRSAPQDGVSNDDDDDDDDDSDDTDQSSDSSSDGSSDSDDSSTSDDDTDDDDDEKDTEDEKTEEADAAPKGGVAPAATAVVEAADQTSPLSEEDESQRLPPYLPAIQGCRSVEEFHCLNRIEEGTYGVVYRARDKQTDEIVALKRLKMEKEKEGFPITSLREINTLLKAQHPNIVTVREIVVGSNMDKIYIVMDYVEHDLKSLMEVDRKSVV